MNKFILLALVAASAVIVAASPIDLDSEFSEMAAVLSDEDEAANLAGTNLEGFRDFCIQTRDNFFSDMRQRRDTFASGVFASIFKSITGITESGLEANKRATDRLSAQLMNPDSPIAEISQDKIDQVIADGQKAIQTAASQPQGFFAALKAGVNSFAIAGYGEFRAILDDLKQNLGPQAIIAHLITACELMVTYEQQNKEIFEQTKAGLVAENPEQYKSVTFAQVAPKCVTSGRLSMADGFCRFVRATKGSLARMAGITLNADNSEQ